MKVVLTNTAKSDLKRLIAYFEAARTGSGTRFQHEVERIVETLYRLPQLYSLTEDGVRGFETRNAIIERFEVLVVYMVLPDSVKILSILHGRRRPGAWHGSLNEE